MNKLRIHPVPANPRSIVLSHRRRHKGHAALQLAPAHEHFAEARRKPAAQLTRFGRLRMAILHNGTYVVMYSALGSGRPSGQRRVAELYPRGSGAGPLYVGCGAKTPVGLFSKLSELRPVNRPKLRIEGAS
jgi:hypothetical protein